MAENNEYLVRGAYLVCTKGSHPRRLNLPTCHGVYVLEHPVIRIDDCLAEENITYFGVCHSESPPTNTTEIRLAGFVPEGEQAETPEVQGLKCIPDILEQWKSVHEQTLISGDFPAATTSSYLICACGGIIQPVTSGQEYKGDKYWES